MKKIIFILILLAGFIGFFNSSLVRNSYALATGCVVNWNLLGNWALSVKDSKGVVVYLPHITIDTQASDGTLSGTYQLGGPLSTVYPMKGTINSNSVMFNLGYVPLILNGSVLNNGTLKGTWTNGYWNSTSGKATKTTICK
jgi:hypothetical protein